MAAYLGYTPSNNLGLIGLLIHYTDFMLLTDTEAVIHTLH